MTEQPKSLSIDVAKYQHLLDDADLSDAEKRAFLEALWQIITAFVDLGYSVEACGQGAETDTPAFQDMVHLTHAEHSKDREAAHE